MRHKLFSIPKAGSPFRPGCDYDILFRESRIRQMDATTLVNVVARKIHKDPRKVKFDVYILSNPKSASNKHKCSLDERLLERKGVLRFVAAE